MSVVLVTGYDGYIGRVLVPMLHDSGYDVRGLDAGWYEWCSFGPEPADVPNIRKDLRDLELDDLAGADAVIHLAAISNDPVADLDPETTYAVNHRASVRLARLAKLAGVERFVFASSCSLYGRADSNTPLDESATFNPVTAYGHSKVLVERDVSELADESFSPVFLRNATVFGVSPRLRLDVMVNNLTAWAVATGEVVVMSDGTPWRPLVHIDDVCRTVLAVLQAPRQVIHGEAFNVGRDSENYRVRRVADIVADVVPGSRVVFAPGGGPDERSYRVDFSKLAATFPDLELRGTVPDGVAELADAYAREGLGLEELQSSRYTRLRRIRELKGNGVMDDSLRLVGVATGWRAR
jgi:nucleoside-diphosphate-sugar epimerase